MARWTNIVVILASACLFAWAVPLLRLFDAFTPIITALSIMVAAVFVRLNRGIPALEWKSVDPNQRKQLTSQIVALSEEYGRIIAINTAVLAGLLALTVVGKDEVAARWPLWTQHLAAGAIGGAGALCVARMVYVVWRDIDVVRLQKRLIDDAASQELAEQQSKLANDKIESIRAAGIRKVEVPAPKAWGK